MKTLTKESKIHLAAVVDDYELHLIQGIEHFRKDGDTPSDWVYYQNYNPNDPDSPMKYLKGIIDNLSSIDTEMLFEYVSPRWITDCIDEILEDVLILTGFKGEVWEA